MTRKVVDGFFLRITKALVDVSPIPFLATSRSKRVCFVLDIFGPWFPTRFKGFIARLLLLLLLLLVAVCRSCSTARVIAISTLHTGIVVDGRLAATWL